MKVYVGCCGFALAIKKYFEEFQTIELQSTFYKLPKIETAKKWRKQSPEDFIFTVKCNQAISHPATSPTWKRSGIKEEELKKLKDRVGFLRPTKEVFGSWNQTLKICKVLDAPICLIQLPASFKENEENIKNAEKFFERIKRDDMKIALELRGWSAEMSKNMCKKFDLIEVTDPFIRLPSYSNGIAYFRLHGSYEKNRINYNYKYSKRDMGKLKDIILSLKAKEVFVFFNNLYMREDAVSLKRIWLNGCRNKKIQAK